MKMRVGSGNTWAMRCHTGRWVCVLPALLCFLRISLSLASSNIWASLENALSLDTIKSKIFKSMKYLSDLSVIYISSIFVIPCMNTVSEVDPKELCPF